MSACVWQRVNGPNDGSAERVVRREIRRRGLKWGISTRLRNIRPCAVTGGRISELTKAIYIFHLKSSTGMLVFFPLIWDVLYNFHVLWASISSQKQREAKDLNHGSITDRRVNTYGWTSAFVYSDLKKCPAKTTNDMKPGAARKHIITWPLLPPAWQDDGSWKWPVTTDRYWSKFSKSNKIFKSIFKLTALLTDVIWMLNDDIINLRNRFNNVMYSYTWSQHQLKLQSLV